VEEVRAGLQAQLVAAQQLAEERKQARDQIAQQLADLARAETKRRDRRFEKESAGEMKLRLMGPPDHRAVGRPVR